MVSNVVGAAERAHRSNEGGLVLHAQGGGNGGTFSRGADAVGLSRAQAVLDAIRPQIERSLHEKGLPADFVTFSEPTSRGTDLTDDIPGSDKEARRVVVVSMETQPHVDPSPAPTTTETAPSPPASESQPTDQVFGGRSDDEPADPSAHADGGHVRQSEGQPGDTQSAVDVSRSSPPLDAGVESAVAEPTRPESDDEATDDGDDLVYITREEFDARNAPRAPTNPVSEIGLTESDVEQFDSPPTGPTNAGAESGLGGDHPSVDEPNQLTQPTDDTGPTRHDQTRSTGPQPADHPQTTPVDEPEVAHDGTGEGSRPPVEALSEFTFGRALSPTPEGSEEVTHDGQQPIPAEAPPMNGPAWYGGVGDDGVDNGDGGQPGGPSGRDRPAIRLLPPRSAKRPAPPVDRTAGPSRPAGVGRGEPLPEAGGDGAGGRGDGAAGSTAPLGDEPTRSAQSQTSQQIPETEPAQHVPGRPTGPQAEGPSHGADTAAADGQPSGHVDPSRGAALGASDVPAPLQPLPDPNRAQWENKLATIVDDAKRALPIDEQPLPKPERKGPADKQRADAPGSALEAWNNYVAKFNAHHAGPSGSGHEQASGSTRADLDTAHRHLTRMGLNPDRLVAEYRGLSEPPQLPPKPPQLPAPSPQPPAPSPQAPARPTQPPARIGQNLVLGGMDVMEKFDSGDVALKYLKDVVIREAGKRGWERNRERITALFSDDGLRPKVPGMLRGGQTVSFVVGLDVHRRKWLPSLSVGTSLTISVQLDGDHEDSHLDFANEVKKYTFEQSSDPTGVAGSLTDARTAVGVLAQVNVADSSPMVSETLGPSVTRSKRRPTERRVPTDRSAVPRPPRRAAASTGTFGGTFHTRSSTPGQSSVGGGETAAMSPSKRKWWSRPATSPTNRRWRSRPAT